MLIKQDSIIHPIINVAGLLVIGGCGIVGHMARKFKSAMSQVVRWKKPNRPKPRRAMRRKPSPS